MASTEHAMPATASAFKEPAADSSATIMLNEHRPCAAASEARDGEAPESSHDGSLREKQHKGGAVCVCLASHFLKQVSALIS